MDESIEEQDDAPKQDDPSESGSQRADSVGQNEELAIKDSTGGDGETKGIKAKDVDSLESFLTYAYERNGQRLSLTKNAQKKISAAPELSRSTRARLCAAAHEDRRLAVVPQLLLTILRVEGYPLARNAIRGFVQDVLLSHRLVTRADLEPVIRNLPDSDSVSDAVRRIYQLSKSQIQDLVEDNQLSPAKVAEIKRNITNSIFLWAMVTRGQSLAGLVDNAYRSTWKGAARKIKTDEEKVRRILSIKDTAALGLIGNSFHNELDAALRVSARLERANDKQAAQIKDLKTQVQDLAQKLSEQTDALKEARTKTENLKQQSESELMHQQDSYEQLRGRLLGRLRKEADLLEEGLHALRQPKPRLAVMDDHAERVLERLREEIENMEAEPGE